MNLVQEKDCVANVLAIIDEVGNCPLAFFQLMQKGLIIEAFLILLN